MARVFTDGAEFGDVLLWSDPANVSAVTSQKRSGNYSYQVTASPRINISALSEFYFRMGFFIWSDAWMKDLVQFRNGTANLCSLAHISGWQIVAKVNDSVVATTPASYTYFTWHLLEVHLVIGDSGTFEVKVDGVQVITYSGDTKPTSATTVDNLYWNLGGYLHYCDDLALNNTSGGVDDSWCGDGHVELLTPNGNGDTNQWTGSDGDTTNNYQLVDDIPATGDDYVKDSTAGHQDMYNLTDFTATGKIIKRVWPECRAKDNDNTAGQIKLGMKTASTHLGSAITLPGVYARVVGDEETTNPADGTAWEDSDLDSIQFVVECE